jgi:membrane protease YdiL (CAAX protease family)
MASFQTPDSAFVYRYLLGYIAILLLGGPLGEEPGWRGFALPRMQQRYGPLVGSLILGFFWGLWHLPAFILMPGYNGAGNGFVGITSAFVPFVIGIIALAIIYTWVSNNTRNSLFLAILFHASFNSAGSMFATLFSPTVAESLLANVIEELIFVGVALLLVVVTRGRLSYQRIQQETESLTPIFENAGEIK